ncbi:MAG: tRNA uracil 4-sulfurtransferase ThiI [Candidatus Binatia bacterium]
MSAVVLRYHEIMLKRGNRHRFTARLIRNVRRACEDLPLGRVADRHGRIVAALEQDEAWPAVRERLGRVFGVANFSLSRSFPIPDPCASVADLRPLGEAIHAAVRELRFESFRVTTKRGDKRFPIPSPEVNAAIGAHLKERTGARVDLEHADLTVTIEIIPGEVLYSVGKVPGAGGLPVGTSDHVVALLSGGIDSPVAAARVMRRGCRVTFVHFHGAPYLDRSSQEKCRELVRRLVAFQFDARLVLIPFGDAQKEIVTRVSPPPRVILYRRMMVRIASRIARGIGAAALVTGDSLAQVASQTLANLAVVEEAADLPLLRPLVGMDKLEVTDEARRLGTFEVSIEPDQDCCSLFVPRHPTTRSRLDLIRHAESALDVPRLVEAAIAGASVERYLFPNGPREPKPEPLRLRSRRSGIEAARAGGEEPLTPMHVKAEP